MEGICALFQEKVKVRKSHLYPKFAVNYLTQTGSKFLRRVVEPDRRMQDGVKFYLLGDKAEQEFSKREKWFSENIFIPFHFKEKKCFEYDENLHYFATSFLWRVLAMQIQKPESAIKPHFPCVLKAFKEWRKYLLNPYSENIENDVFISLTGRILEHNLPARNVDGYYTRALDSTIVFNKDYSSIIVYGKFTRFVFWSVLWGERQSFKFEHSIDPIGGTLHANRALLGEDILNFMNHRIIQLDEFPFASDMQSSKMEKELMRSYEKDPNSDFFKSLFQDFSQSNDEY